MGESASARTERELADLRASLDVDIRELQTRVREDLDPRRLVRRQPVAVLGTLGSLAALTGYIGYKKLDLRGPTRSINSLKETMRWAKARLLGRSAS